MKRHKSYPNMYQKETGVWYFIKTIGKIRYKKSTGKKKIREALEVAQKIESDILKEQDLTKHQKNVRAKQKVKNPPMDMLWIDFMAVKNAESLDESTIKNYNTCWNHASKFWANVYLNEFNQAKIKAWERHFISENKKYLKAHGKCLLYADIIKNFKSFVNWLVLEELLEEPNRKGFKFEDLDKTTFSKLNPNKEKHSETYTRKECEKLTAMECPVAGLPTRIALYSGPRMKEILSLRTENVYETIYEGRQALVMKLWSSKNKYWREVPVPPIIREELLKKVAHSKSKGWQWVFVGLRDRTKHLTNQVLSRYFNDAKSKFVKKRKTFHDLRRTFATMTAEQGWPSGVACKILDMKQQRYEDIYSKPRLDVKIDLMNSVSLANYRADAVVIKGDKGDE